MKCRQVKIVLAFVIVILCNNAYCLSDDHVSYKTWSPWEVDAVLTAWGIRKYKSPNAVFESVAKGTSVDKILSLDTPYSNYKRTGTKSAFQVFVESEFVKDKCVTKLVEISKILELTAWRKSEYPYAVELEEKLVPFIPRRPIKGGLMPAFKVIDDFCGYSQ